MSGDNVLRFPGVPPLPVSPSVIDDDEAAQDFADNHWGNLLNLMQAMAQADDLTEYRAYKSEFNEAWRRVPM